ncbi:F-box domain containing protein [Parasponia andersonii]|uniref:F-box domain containing protein n=1 Tax=Parasponia andersonii TaxID=3476 RepID=A0A2P5A998_PARAD|nr:F-box domain containing protein [Parasponia andersonii]
MAPVKEETHFIKNNVYSRILRDIYRHVIPVPIPAVLSDLINVYSSIVITWVTYVVLLCFPSLRSPGNQIKIQHGNHANRTTSLPAEQIIHTDLIPQIAENLTSFQDLVAVSQVCRSWRNVLSSSGSSHRERVPKPPCLMLSAELPMTRSFFSLYNNRVVFKLYLPADSSERRFWGSPHGWLASVDFPNKSVQLLNPISQAKLDLPFVVPNVNYEALRAHWSDMLVKMLVLKIKIQPPEFLVMAIFCHRLGFNRPGRDDHHWILVDNPDNFSFKDATYFESQIYVICEEGTLRVDFHDGLDPTRRISPAELMDFRDRPITTRLTFLAPHPVNQFVGHRHERTGRVYIAASPDELYGLFRYSSKDFGYERTITFSLYKLDFDSLDWEAVECINDEAAIFIGNGNSWSICEAQSVNCRTNSIYFTDDTRSGSGLDVGVYCMKTGVTESLRFGANVPLSQPLAAWITPGLIPFPLILG